MAMSLSIPQDYGSRYSQQSGTFTASPAQRAPIQADSIFDLASLTKILSTQALLYGAEIEGKLSLEDPVPKILSGI